jgi:hypothetical protein
MKYIAIVRENVQHQGELTKSQQYDDATKYEFSSDEERRDFLKTMSGVLYCIDAYYVA